MCRRTYSLERVCSYHSTEGASLQAGVEPLSGHNTGSNREDFLRVHKGCSPEVGAGAYRLEDGADCDEAGNIRHAKVILAGLDWPNTDRLNGRNQKLNMGRLVRRDEFQIDEELFVESLVEKILLLEASESFLVKSVLKVLELSQFRRHDQAIIRQDSRSVQIAES
jgi:hypothetical protein